MADGTQLNAGVTQDASQQTGQQDNTGTGAPTTGGGTTTTPPTGQTGGGSGQTGTGGGVGGVAPTPPQTSTETQLEITPQPADMKVGDTQTLTINTDADSVSVTLDNDNATYDDASKTLEAVKEGNTHIKATATAQGKTEKIVEWDLAIAPKDSAGTPTPPATDPSVPQEILPSQPTLKDVDLEVGDRYITEKHNIVDVLYPIGEVIIVSGARAQAFMCELTTIENLGGETKTRKIFTKWGMGIENVAGQRYYVGNGMRITEADSNVCEVLDKFIVYSDTAIVGAQNPTGAKTYMARSAIQSIVFNEKLFTMEINKEFKIALFTEAKLAQVKKFILG